jgi:hypothetical protein
MRRYLAILLSLAALSVQAHIGSPNVFFDGQAGEYPVHVIIRPPNVVPGVAEIVVRVEGEGVQHVTALPVFWDAGRKGAPPPDEAKPVHGETNLYTTSLWLMKPGSYSVDVNIEGARKGGTVMVPVDAIATNTNGMSHSLTILLAVLAIVLFAGAVRIAGAVFGEGRLAPGESMDSWKILRSRIAMVITALVIWLALWGGKKWWDFSEREYREKTLYHAAALSARVLEQTNQDLLELTINEPDDVNQTPQLMPDHGKLMHLFLIRQPGLDAFAHLHPVKQTWDKFKVSLPPLPAGHYEVYADITHETGLAETLTAVTDLPKPSAEILQGWTGGSSEPICGSGIIRTAPVADGALLPDADDSWHINHESLNTATNVARLDNGLHLVWLTSGDLIENNDLSLRFQLVDASGKAEQLQPYIGMFGHAVVRRDDGKVFAHIHPSGTFSMAAQAYYEGVTNSMHMDSSNSVREVSFPYAFPSPGAYHLWVQLKSGGKAYTGVFEAAVKAAK